MSLQVKWSQKFNEDISWYSEDVDWRGEFWAAPGVGNTSGEEYDVVFSEDDNENLWLRTIVRHNELE